MNRKPNKAGGGANTNLNGLEFERKTSLLEDLEKHPNFIVQENNILRGAEIVAIYYEKRGLYSKLLQKRGIDYSEHISKREEPDGALLVNKTIYIIEKKFQSQNGSVDEKLQTCDFKKKQYKKLFVQLDIKVEYFYLLNDWYTKPKYKDVKDYILSVGCKYFINTIPINELGLE